MRVKATGSESGYDLVDKETNNKATARRRKNGKFDITINGETYHNNSLRDCKELLAKQDQNDDGGEDERPGPGNRGAWDCVHPCAWVIEFLAVAEDRIKGSPDFERVWPEIRETLDCFGYITPEGEIDAVAARREISHWCPEKPDKRSEDQSPSGD